MTPTRAPRMKRSRFACGPASSWHWTARLLPSPLRLSTSTPAWPRSARAGMSTVSPGATVIVDHVSACGVGGRAASSGFEASAGETGRASRCLQFCRGRTRSPPKECDQRAADHCCRYSQRAACRDRPTPEMPSLLRPHAVSCETARPGVGDELPTEPEPQGPGRRSSPGSRRPDVLPARVAVRPQRHVEVVLVASTPVLLPALRTGWGG
jgi:hypothetical protein